jgi:hypothetical protein
MIEWPASACETLAGQAEITIGLNRLTWGDRARAATISA